MDLFIKSLLVGFGGALGSVARYWISLLAARLVGEAFPWGTLVINILGSFVIGYYGTLTLQAGPFPASSEARLFVMVGICGGFTTFSSFSLQTLQLLQGGEAVRAAAYIVASVVLCVLGTTIGYLLVAGHGIRI